MNEGDRIVSVTVELIEGEVDEPTLITITTSDMSATGKSINQRLTYNVLLFSPDDVDSFGCFDYSGTSVNVVFSAGTTPGGPGSQRTVSIPITDDNCVEILENFRVTATSSDPDVVFPQGPSSTVNIIDNDSEYFIPIISCDI